MSDSRKGLPSIDRLKQRAKDLKKELKITHAEALDLIGKKYGFLNWQAILSEFSHKPDTKDTAVVAEQRGIYNLDRTKAPVPDSLAVEPQKKVEQNRRALTKAGVEFSVFEVTATGLKKSILDATQPVRTHFELENFHFYYEQAQGPEHKVVKDAFLLTDNFSTPSKLSLYRPKTKQGDPRMWFRGLPSFASPEDHVAIIVYEGSAYLINISNYLLEASVERVGSKIGELIRRYNDTSNSVANELLDKLRVLSQNPFPALRKGDTGIGYTLESMLGIAANSSKKPDYKGIELKSGRGSKTRTTLFAQVADWSISPCKKSAEILDKYGYVREDDFKLYCTISAQNQNPQGLSFRYDESRDEVQEIYNEKELVAVWPGKLLRQRLREKHAETFWVQAETEVINNREYFDLVKVTHTKSPITSQLMPLISSGVVTMDHLIKRSGSTNRVTEKGPLFKMDKKNLDLLFPSPLSYSLR